MTICQRLKLSGAERQTVESLVANHMFFYTPEWTDGTVRRFVRRVGVAELPALLALREADVIGRGFDEEPDKETRELRRRVAEVVSADAALTVKDLAVGGRDLMQALAIPPGPLVGQAARRPARAGARRSQPQHARPLARAGPAADVRRVGRPPPPPAAGR